jgi:catechol 2,3-dioxygenase-like lactoylglutathione lyase family enzyme
MSVVRNGYALHWVFRVSDLAPSLTFLKDVFGMKVLRHEENTSA